MQAERDVHYGGGAGPDIFHTKDEDRESHDKRFREARRHVQRDLILCGVLALPVMTLNILALSDVRLAQVTGLAWWPWASLAYFLVVLALAVLSIRRGLLVFGRYGPPSSYEVARRLKERVQAASLGTLRAFPGSEEVAAAAQGPSNVVQMPKVKGPAALMVVHGIGVQERYETLDAVTEGLTTGLKGHEWGFDLLGDCTLDQVPPGCTEEDLYGKRLRNKTGKTLDVYELYWAPIVEGIMTWKDVLAWTATIIGRLPRRLQLAIKGSHTLPHPDSLNPRSEDEEERRLGLLLQDWVRKTQSDVKTKARYTLGYLAIVLALVGVVFIGVVKVWQVGLGLSAAIPVDPEQAAEQAAILAANPCVQHRMAGEACLLSDLWTSVPEESLDAAQIQLVTLFAESEKPLTAICGGSCGLFSKLYLAGLIGRGYSLGDYFDLSVGTLLNYPLQALFVMLVTVLAAYGAIHAGKAWNRRKADPKYKQIGDIEAAQDKAHFYREGLRSASLALVSLSLYVLMMSAFVLYTVSQGNSEMIDDVTAVAMVTLCTGIAYMAVYQGVLPFLARYVADVPLQANRSTYSKGHQARMQVQEKAVQLLGQLLRQYESVVVIAHSQGTVVTYEMFHNYQRRLDRQAREAVENPLPPLTGVRSYVTIGVALSKVQDLVQGFDDPGASQWTLNRRLFNTRGIEGVEYFYPCDEGHIRWFNYWMMSDIVANPLRDYLPVQEKMIEWHTYSPRAVWTHSDYWVSVSFYESLVETERSAIRLAYPPEPQQMQAL